MPRNSQMRREDRQSLFSSWPMWVAALIAIGVIDLALYLPKPA
jgi:hypothetical protein